MSELPNFKEGFIFDATQNTTTLENPFIVVQYKPLLFKIASISDYSTNYQYWSYVNNYGVNKIMQVIEYNNLSFITPIGSTKNERKLIMWNGGIYLYLFDDFHQSDYTLNLTRCADKNGSVQYNTITIYLKNDMGKTPSISYDNNSIFLGNNGYEIILNNPVTTLDWIYNMNNGTDTLKYYQFLLYNTNEQGMINKCVIDTGKIYTDTTDGNGFICNSLDDNSKYILVGYCVTQNGQRLDLPDLTVKTAYTTGRIYTNLTIELNKHCAENTVCAEVVNLVGSAVNEEAVFVDGEKVDLKINDNAVVFTDTYNLLTDNFLIRLWINGIKEGNRVTVLKLTNPNNSDYIEVYYDNGYFYAVKYSYGLICQYISNAVDENDVLNGNLYLAMLCCNGRIDIYTTSYTESEVIAQ